MNDSHQKQATGKILASQGNYAIRFIVDDDLPYLLRWRNLESVRKYMYTDHIISPEEHARWYDTIKADQAKAYLMFTYEHRPVGLSNFNGVNPEEGKCLWGFYLGETDLPKGSGTILGYLSLNYIFEQRDINKVSGEVLDFNLPSRNFFERLGFQHEGIMRKYARKGTELIDVHLFGMLRAEWLMSHKKRIMQLINRHES